MEKTRELYKQKYEAQLHEWSAKIEALSAHADKLTADAKLEAAPGAENLQVEVERIETAIPIVSYPRIIRRVGKSPPQYPPDDS